MKSSDFTTKILHLFNLIAILVITNEILMIKPDYFGSFSIGMGLAGIGLSLLVFVSKKKWLEAGYHLLFAVFFGVNFLTFPMGIAFALTGGIRLTIIILFTIYLPLLLLLIFNGRQAILRIRNHSTKF
ncbi:hypothetical protein [Capnocytophaga felis]|uniref:hypothetical protein n=1 Tax=Capnocytophaga felis TaxID=2267611 RepID=UPI0012D2E9FE|nr:hypothetical protein [Capnocytophaga felis]